MVAAKEQPVVAQAEVVRAELTRIAEAHEGVLNPEDVVEAARPKTSPLHDYFLWDNTEAAHRYRNTQAAILIRRVKLTIMREEGAVRTVTMTRAFESLPEARRDPDGNGSYEAVEAILSDDTKRASLLAAVMQELRALRRKYETLSELSRVWEAVAEVEDAI